MKMNSGLPLTLLSCNLLEATWIRAETSLVTIFLLAVASSKNSSIATPHTSEQLDGTSEIFLRNTKTWLVGHVATHDTITGRTWLFVRTGTNSVVLFCYFRQCIQVQDPWETPKAGRNPSQKWYSNSTQQREVLIIWTSLCVATLQRGSADAGLTLLDLLWLTSELSVRTKWWWCKWALTTTITPSRKNLRTRCAIAWWSDESDCLTCTKTSSSCFCSSTFKHLLLLKRPVLIGAQISKTREMSFLSACWWHKDKAIVLAMPKACVRIKSSFAKIAKVCDSHTRTCTIMHVLNVTRTCRPTPYNYTTLFFLLRVNICQKC